MAAGDTIGGRIPQSSNGAGGDAGSPATRVIEAADGLAIAFDVADVSGIANAPTVVLVHGFASDRRSNWVRTRWVAALVEAGFRVIAPDLRGHGDSGRPRTLAAYALPRFLDDLTAVLDSAGAAEVHLVGYSLGSRLVWEYALRHPDRVLSITMGGPPVLGSFAGFDLSTARDAMRAGETHEVDDAAAEPNAETARYLAMARRPGNDPEALLRVAEAVRRRAFRPRAAAPGHPLLIVSGEDDEVHDASRMLAADLETARFVGLPGRDHVSAVTSRVFKAETVAFLEAVEQARAKATRPTGA